MINKNKYFFIMINSILLISIFTNTINAYLIHDLVIQYAPEIHFHPQEKYFPIEMNDYISKCALQKRDKADPSNISLEKYPISSKDIIQDIYIPDDYNNYTKNYNTPMSLEQLQVLDQALFKKFDAINDYFISPNHCYPGAKNDKKIIDTVHQGIRPDNKKDKKAYPPCYYHVQERPDHKGHVIQYIFMYAHQGPLLPDYSLTKIIPYIYDIGVHEADVEHLDVYVDKKGQVEWVYFSAHGSDPFGEMLPASKVSFNNGHPIAYAAKYGHALHSKAFGLDAPKIVQSTLSSFFNPFNIAKRVELAKDVIQSIWGTVHSQQTQDKGYTFDTTAQGGPIMDCQHYLIDLGTRQKPALGQEWILFAGRLGCTFDTVNGSALDHVKRGNFIFNNSPACPSVDNSWWRTSVEKLHLATIYNLKQGSTIDLLKIIPTRIRKIACIIKNSNIQKIYLKGLTGLNDIHTIVQQQNTAWTHCFINAQETFTHKSKLEVISVQGTDAFHSFDLEIWGFED